MEVAKYYRFKNVDDNYLSASDVLAVTDEADASTIFYLTEERKLVAYSNGLFLNGTGGFEDGGHIGNIAYFKSGSVDNTVMVGVAKNAYLGSNAADVAADGADWTVEEVTSLPVAITSIEYATLYAPVALQLPEGIKAHTVTVNGNWLDLSEGFNIVPANTAVLLSATEGAYDLEIIETDIEIESVLEGSVAATVVEGNAYMLSHVNGKTGFYKAKMAYLDGMGFLNNGHRAYLPASKTNGVSFYGFRGEGTTAVEEVEIENVNVNTVHDLAGRKIDAPVKGIYIINGEKKIIK